MLPAALRARAAASLNSAPPAPAAAPVASPLSLPPPPPPLPPPLPPPQLAQHTTQQQQPPPSSSSSSSRHYAAASSSSFSPSYPKPAPLPPHPLFDSSVLDDIFFEIPPFIVDFPPLPLPLPFSLCLPLPETSMHRHLRRSRTLIPFSSTIIRPLSHVAFAVAPDLIMCSPEHCDAQLPLDLYEFMRAATVSAATAISGCPATERDKENTQFLTKILLQRPPTAASRALKYLKNSLIGSPARKFRFIRDFPALIARLALIASISHPLYCTVAVESIHVLGSLSIGCVSIHDFEALLENHVADSLLAIIRRQLPRACSCGIQSDSYHCCVHAGDPLVLNKGVISYPGPCCEHPTMALAGDICLLIAATRALADMCERAAFILCMRPLVSPEDALVITRLIVCPPHPLIAEYCAIVLARCWETDIDFTQDKVSSTNSYSSLITSPNSLVLSPTLAKSSSSSAYPSNTAQETPSPSPPPSVGAAVGQSLAANPRALSFTAASTSSSRENVQNYPTHRVVSRTESNVVATNGESISAASIVVSETPAQEPFSHILSQNNNVIKILAEREPPAGPQNAAQAAAGARHTPGGTPGSFSSSGGSRRTPPGSRAASSGSAALATPRPNSNLAANVDENNTDSEHSNQPFYMEVLAGLLPMVASAQSARATEVALMTLASLARGDRNMARSILNSEHAGFTGLELIRSRMWDDRPSCRLQAVKCIVRLMESRELVLTSTEITLTLFPCLLELMEGTRELKSEAALTLAMLLRDNSELQAAFYEGEGLKKIIAALKAVHKTVVDPNNPHHADVEERVHQSLLLALASSCSLNEASRSYIVESIVLPIVTVSLGSPNETVRGAAAHLARSISRSVKTLRSSLLDSGVSGPLFKQLMGETSPFVLATVTATICNLVLDFAPMKDLIVDSGGIERFAELTEHSDAHIRLNATWALKNIVYNASSDCKGKLVKILTIPRIVELMKATDINVQEQVLNMVRNIVSERAEDIDMFWDGVGGNEFMELFATLTASPFDNVLHQALYVLVNIATGREEHKNAIIECTAVMQNIKNALSHPNMTLRIAATWIIINLTWADETRPIIRVDALRELGFEECLRELANDPDSDVRDRARGALSQFQK